MPEPIKRYLAYDAGCPECGEPSGVIGLYDTRREAEAAVERAVERQAAAWRGEHEMRVIDLADPMMSEWADA